MKEDREPVAKLRKSQVNDECNRNTGTVRNYRHSRNADGGINSICTRCGILIASSHDEWNLLADEHQHTCKTGENPG
jgi:hypothetical protein